MTGRVGVALVTGASRGIGRGIALALAQAGGYDLALNFNRSAGAAVETAEACLAAAAAAGHALRAAPVQADIASAADRELLVATVSRTLGDVDLLVNNAGVAPVVRADVLEAGEESFDRLMATNVKGPYFLTQLVARSMVERFRAGSGGPAPAGRNIITIGSISAYTASTNRGDYCLSKAALAMHTKLWAARLAEFGIGVFEVRPGIIETDMTAAVKEVYDAQFAAGLTPIARWGTPEDVGRAVTAIASGAFPYSTGMVVDVDGGFALRRL